MEHTNPHTPETIVHNKEVHSFYIFVILVTVGILILQPITMVFLVIAQSLMQ